MAQAQQLKKTGGNSTTKQERQPRLSLIPVQKERLIEIISNNRDGHRKTFEKALDGFHKTIVEELEKRVQQAKEKKEINQYLGLEMPKDYTDSYDKVLKQLELTEDEIIYLDDTEVESYIMDNWSWKRQFTQTSSAYINQ